jgi:isochorismate pyruvate lyase
LGRVDAVDDVGITLRGGGKEGEKKSGGHRPVSLCWDGLNDAPLVGGLQATRQSAARRYKTGMDPEDCKTMVDVRAGVDEVDRQVVALLARRFGYMDAAARIKPDREAVRDEWRKADVLAKVDAAAEQLGVDRRLMARLYEDLIETSIAHEFEEFDRRRS